MGKEEIMIGVLFVIGIVYAVLAWSVIWLFKGLWIGITKVFEWIDKGFDLILKI